METSPLTWPNPSNVTSCITMPSVLFTLACDDVSEWLIVVAEVRLPVTSIPAPALIERVCRASLKALSPICSSATGSAKFVNIFPCPSIDDAPIVSCVIPPAAKPIILAPAR